MLVELTTVPDQALPLQQLKDHLRLGSGFSDDGLQDALLTGFLRAALSVVEGRTGKALLERQFSWTQAAWRDQRVQVLPIAPVSVVATVTLIDAAGGEVDVPGTLWRLDPDLHGPRLCARGSALPLIPTDGTVRIVFDAGFGPDWSDLPADLAQAVILLAAHYNEFRHEVDLGPGCMPFGVSALIDRYRSVRLFGGART